jgi:hypothetical protein
MSDKCRLAFLPLTLFIAFTLVLLYVCLIFPTLVECTHTCLSLLYIEMLLKR